MLKNKQEKAGSRGLKSNAANWDAVIYDANQIIVRFSKLIVRLKASIKSFEEMRDSGVKFPERKRGRPSKGY